MTEQEKRELKSFRDAYKKCPYCGELIRLEAIKCRFCGEFLIGREEQDKSGPGPVIPDSFLLSVIVPVFNELGTIREILLRILQVPIRKEIIVVDDCSQDGTKAFLETVKKNPFGLWPDENFHDWNTVKILFHDRNQGKGAAIRSGIHEAGGDVVLIQDADLEYDPQEYFRLLQPILENKADVVYGSRFIGDMHRVLYFWHYFGNNLLTLLSNIFTDLNLTDMETCYKVFKRDIIGRIEIKENRFGFEPEITAKVAKLGCRIYEVPISYSGRDYSEGKKINWRDGLWALVCILRYNLFS